MDHGGAGVSARDVLDFERRRNAEQLRDADCLPQRIDGMGVVVAALNRNAERAHPLEQKRQLKDFIRAAVRDDRLAESIIGGFADNVLMDRLPEEVILKAIDELNKVKIHTSRGGTFQRIMQRMLGERGIAQRGLSNKSNLHSHQPGHGRPETPRAP